MPLQLPAPDTSHLSLSPLTLVVCQVRYDSNVQVADTGGALYDAFKSDYPIFDTNASQDVGLVPSSSGIQAVPGPAAKGWKFQSKDNSWTVIVMQDFFALQTIDYTNWDEYKERLRSLTQSIQLELSPNVERRLGLRYVNRLADPAVTKPSDWIGRLHSSVLGPITHPAMGQSLNMMQALIQIDLGEDLQAIVRFGSAQERELNKSWVYFLDNDCSREGGRPFSVHGIMEGVEVLHTNALQLFQASLTETYFAQLKRGGSG